VTSARAGATQDNLRNVAVFSVPLTDATDHLTTAITATGATDFADVRFCRAVSINVVNGASNSAIFTVEGSLDGTNFETVAYGSGSSAAYTQAAKTTTADDDDLLFLPPDDHLRYVRVNVATANANGTSFTVYGRS
jgi:ATP-dependent protease HslVU (ClpYQ) peptidase subunit